MISTLGNRNINYAKHLNRSKHANDRDGLGPIDLAGRQPVQWWASNLVSRLHQKKISAPHRIWLLSKRADHATGGPSCISVQQSVFVGEDDQLCSVAGGGFHHGPG